MLPLRKCVLLSEIRKKASLRCLWLNEHEVRESFTPL